MSDGNDIYVMRSQTIFPPARPRGNRSEPRGRPLMEAVAPEGTTLESLSLEGPAGVISAALVRRQAPGPLFLFLGGNNHYMAKHAAANVEKLIRFGDVLVFDHPGYGDSESEALFSNILPAGARMVGHACRLAEARGQKTVVWSASFGGYMAIRGAAEYQPEGIILEGLAPSAVDWAHALGARQGLSKARVEKEMVEGGIPDPITGYDGAVLQLAGLGDTVVPIQLSRKLKAFFEKNNIDFDYHEIDVASHDLRVSPQTLRVVRDFLLTRNILTADQVLDPMSFRANAITFQSGPASLN